MAKKEQTNLEVKEPTSLDELDFSQKADGLFAGFVEPEEEDLTTGEDDKQEGANLRRRSLVKPGRGGCFRGDRRGDRRIRAARRRTRQAG